MEIDQDRTTNPTDIHDPAENERFADCREGNHRECLYQWPNPEAPDTLITCSCVCHNQVHDPATCRAGRARCPVCDGAKVVKLPAFTTYCYYCNGSGFISAPCSACRSQTASTSKNVSPAELSATETSSTCPECGFIRYRPEAEYHDFGCSRAPQAASTVENQSDSEAVTGNPASLRTFAEIQAEWANACEQMIDAQRGEDAARIEALLQKLCSLGNKLLLEANLSGIKEGGKL